jgi:hypothetical protein
MKHRAAFVFFLAADRQPWGRVLRLFALKPAAGWKAFRLRWVQSWGGSDLFHVSIGDGEVVLDSASDGTLFLPQMAYAVGVKQLVLGFEVPVKKCLRLGSFANLPPAPWWKVLLKFLTFGSVWSGDCVDVTRDALANGGVIVPRRIVSPSQLKDWLYSQGYRHEIFP